MYTLTAVRVYIKFYSRSWLLRQRGNGANKLRGGVPQALLIIQAHCPYPGVILFPDSIALRGRARAVFHFRCYFGEEIVVALFALVLLF